MFTACNGGDDFVEGDKNPGEGDEGDADPAVHLVFEGEGSADEEKSAEEEGEGGTAFPNLVRGGRRGGELGDTDDEKEDSEDEG